MIQESYKSVTITREAERCLYEATRHLIKGEYYCTDQSHVTVRLSQRVYSLLEEMMEDGESVSDAILRLCEWLERRRRMTISVT